MMLRFDFTLWFVFLIKGSNSHNEKAFSYRIVLYTHTNDDRVNLKKSNSLFSCFRIYVT